MAITEEVKPMQWTRKFAGGLRADLRRRGPYYVSDWTDAFTAQYRQKCLASTTYMFFACISAAITFGALFDKGTDGQMGAFETILSSAVSGIVWALFSAQPLAIMGATGPELAYTIVFFNMCKSMGLEFLPARVWQGLWCSLFTIILALCDGSALFVYVTQFTEDIFSGLICFMYIIAACISIVKEFNESSNEAAFFQLILALGTFGFSMYFRSLRGTLWMNKSFRNVFANFGVTISILVFSCIAQAFKDVDTETLNMPEKFEPTVKLSDGTVRPWVVNPFGMETDFPVWGIFFTALPAIGLCILGFLDQNLTTLLINRKANNLKKPGGYHLDLFVCGAFIYPICSFFGLPFTHAATIRSLSNMASLTDYKEVVHRDEEKGTSATVKVPDAVAEQRVTQLAIHVLIAVSSTLASALKLVPQPVLYGVFLYMGASSIAGNALFDRMSLWLIWDTSKYPAFPFLRGIELKRLHLYTFIQVLCLAVLFAVAYIKAVAAVFPFFLVFIVIVRLLLPRIFTARELEVLDGTSAEDDDEATGHKGKSDEMFDEKVTGSDIGNAKFDEYITGS
jgi:hypothetical protein